jgi:NAD(P)-dependent dehydrogenase (short-subunit alcohol dehydrogenase family)
MTKNIFITGTNSGFGRLAAVALANAGHHVFATMRDVAGRNREAAEELSKAGDSASGSIQVVEMEVTSAESVNAAVASVHEQVGHLDVVINNAGYGLAGLEETLSDAQLIEQFNVNVVGVHRVLRAVLPGMRERKSGLLIHISSAVGRIVFPFMGAYCASKAALEALADAYRYELKPLSIDSTIVQPGPFPTDFRARLDAGQDSGRASGYGPLANGMEMLAANLSAMIDGPGAQDPQDVVRAIIALIDAEPGTRPDRVVVDKLGGDGVSSLNEAHRTVQQMVLAILGMGQLAE